jgi:hypothetical protein
VGRFNAKLKIERGNICSNPGQNDTPIGEKPYYIQVWDSKLLQQSPDRCALPNVVLNDDV